MRFAMRPNCSPRKAARDFSPDSLSSTPANFRRPIEQYRAALALSPKDYEAHFALGRVLLRSSDAAGAEEQFRAAIASRGDSAPAHLGLASALLAEKKYEPASDALAEYLKLNPGDRVRAF